MLDQLDIESVLFLDIETVSAYRNFDDLGEYEQELWQLKAKFLIKDDDTTAADVYGKAGIYAEFGKIVCISVGFMVSEQHELKLRIKSYYGEDEKLLLEEFNGLLNNHFAHSRYLLCAHNGKEFDFPYIARRMLVNGLRLPTLLDMAGKKPWEIKHLDTMELWKFGDYKHYTSLKLLAHIFGIPTPKDDIDGSQVGKVFWEDDDVERIKTYCQKDVITIVQLVLKYKGLSLIDENNIVVV